MKEDEDAIKSISLEIRDDVGYTEPEWVISESRVQEWRSGQVSIVADFNFTVIYFSLVKRLLQFNTSVLFQIQFLATRGPKSVGFVAIDDFEIFTEEDGVRCPYEPPEADPKPETTTTLESSSGVKSCDFEENLCGWEIQPPEATFSWKRTTIAELESMGYQHPEHTLDGGSDGRLKIYIFFLLIYQVLHRSFSIHLPEHCACQSYQPCVSGGKIGRETLHHLQLCHSRGWYTRTGGENGSRGWRGICLASFAK